MFILEDKGYFLDAISLAWANANEMKVEDVKEAWLETFNKNLSSPTTKIEEAK